MRFKAVKSKFEGLNTSKKLKSSSFCARILLATQRQNNAQEVS